MLDHHALLHDPDAVLGPLRRRGIDGANIDGLRQLAVARREAIGRAEALRHDLNVASDAVQQKARAGDSAAVALARESLRSLKADIKDAEAAQSGAEVALHEALLEVPNLPADSVPDGRSEADNQVLRSVGTPPALPFAAQAHWDLGAALGILDFERAAKVSGARFAVLRGAGARLERALCHLMVDMAVAHGYCEVAPPLLVRRESMLAAGQYPKFVGESFETQDGTHVLVPTSEVPLLNLHRDEILAPEQLPLRYAAATPCFRREAGAAGKDTRGLIRLHQFSKVELFAFTRPEHSEAEHERLTGHAEAVLQRLELPYRVVGLCCGDLGFAARKTYDLEVWLPGQNAYREISSCSNCGDFQARRGRIRYRPDGPTGGRPQLVHTLNGSALAVGRCMVAVLENGQQADGSVRLPAALVPYFGAAQIAAPAA